MNFFKRAIRSVTRQKSKSIILFSVIFVLGNILAGSVIIQQSTQNVEKTTKEQMGAIVSVGVDWNDPKILKELEKSSENIENNLDVKLINKIGKSPYVKNYDYSAGGGFQSKKLKTFDPSADKKKQSNDTTVDSDDTMNQMVGYIQIRGVQDPKLIDIALGKIKLIDGSVFTEEDIQKGTNSIVISQEFANKNGLHVGDEMIIDQELVSIGSDEAEKATTNSETFDTKVKITGIYKVLEAVEKKSGNGNKADSGSVVHAATITGGQDEDALDFTLYNTIYMPNKALHQMNQGYSKWLMEKSPELFSGMSEKGLAEADKPFYSPIYQLKSVDEIEKFKAETTPLLPKFFSIMASTDEFDTIASQFKKLSSIAKVVIVAAILLSVVLILLVVLLFMRDRKRELGVYLSLGDKKSTIILQIMVEVLTIASIALILSLITGKFLGGFASEAFLSSTNNAKTTQDMVTGNFIGYSGIINNGTTFSAETIAENYSVAFTPFYIVTYLLAGIGTVVISVLLSMLYIFKLKPKKILLG